jgi:hypothetical protein
MVTLTRRLVAALTFASGLCAVLAVAQPGPAAADDNGGMQSEGTKSCVVGHRFEPGPIVEGHNRQPTPGEFEARVRELRALNQRSTGSCPAPPLSSTVGDMASGMRPTFALPTSKR